MFLERLSNYGMDSSPYYQDMKYNKGKGTDNDLPNCTQYVISRCYEATESKEPFVMFSGRSAGGYPMAKDFYKDSILPKGSELKLGAIACFDGACGHVAFVERVIDKNHALISESQYDPNKSLRNYKYFQTRIVELTVGKATLQGVGPLLGFIYLPVKDIRTDREPSKIQIAVKEDFVNVRLSPDGNIAVQGCYAPPGVYDVANIKNDGQYDWYKLEKSRYVREGDWITYYPIENDDLVKLQEENRQLRKENEILLNILHDVHQMTGV